MNKKQPVRTCECLLAVKVSNGISFQFTVAKSKITEGTSDNTIDNPNSLHQNDRTHQVKSSKDPLVPTTCHSGSVDSCNVALAVKEKPPSSSKPPKSDPVDTSKGDKYRLESKNKSHQGENAGEKAPW